METENQKIIDNRDNWGHTDWSGGELNIVTGKEVPRLDNKPVAVWWQGISKSTGNTITNIPFFDTGDHITKTSGSAGVSKLEEVVKNGFDELELLKKKARIN